jgi:GT2 family glycosyltransferase
MKFTLIATCFNEMKSLPRWLEDIRKQTRQPDEIIITDAVSKDGTTALLHEWAQRDSRVKVIVERCNAARGRNLAIERAENEHIACTDMGVRVTPTWFEKIVRPFEDDREVQIVMGSYAVDRSTIKSPAARAEYYINGDYRPFIREKDGSVSLRPGFVPGNLSLAYTRTAWEALGRLPEDLTLYADDSVFGRQILASSLKVAFAPEALVLWSRHRKLKEFWAENFRYGKGDGEAAIKTPIAFRLYKNGRLPRSLVPFSTAIRELTRISFWKALGKSFCSGDIIAGLYLPVLVIGKGYHFAKGYIIGDDHGSTYCLECRKRLKSTTMAR